MSEHMEPAGGAFGQEVGVSPTSVDTAPPAGTDCRGAKCRAPGCVACGMVERPQAGQEGRPHGERTPDTDSAPVGAGGATRTPDPSLLQSRSSPAGRPCIPRTQETSSFVDPKGTTYVIDVELSPFVTRETDERTGEVRVYAGAQGRAIEAAVGFMGKPLCRVCISLGASSLVASRDLSNSGFMRGVMRSVLAIAERELARVDRLVEDGEVLE